MRPTRSVIDRGAVTRRGITGGALAAAAALAAPGTLRAQPAWPDRPVRVIVPFPGGSTPDIAARAVANHFQQVFGQPFVVDNRAGAGGAIGTDAIAKATDGATIGVSIGGPGSTARVLNPQLPYDPAIDLAPISLLVRLPIVFAVHPSVPVRTLEEFIGHARANPGRLNYGSVGAGTLGHLVTAEFAARHGLDMTHVPFRSVPQGVTELVAGRIQAMGRSPARCCRRCGRGRCARSASPATAGSAPRPTSRPSPSKGRGRRSGPGSGSSRRRRCRPTGSRGCRRRPGGRWPSRRRSAR
jgi:tripartite-type tricarboxylate transporter receptor subunit TctC